MRLICHIHNYTEYNEEWNVFSAFNPSKCTHLEKWAADCAAPGEQSWTSCRSRDSNPQPWVTSGFKSNALSIRSMTPPATHHTPSCSPSSQTTYATLSGCIICTVYVLVFVVCTPGINALCFRLYVSRFLYTSLIPVLFFALLAFFVS